MTQSWNDPYRDIACKQTDKNGRFLVGYEVGRLVATILVGYVGHRGSINYLAVNPQFLGNGSGLTLVRAAEGFLGAIGYPKINLCVRRENEALIKFYNKSGYTEETVYYFSKRLIDDQ